MIESVRAARSHYDLPITNAMIAAAGDSPLRALPKVELHCHVEGAARATTVAELAAKHGVPLGVDDPDDLTPTIHSAATFNLDVDAMVAIRDNAVEASWLDDVDKAALRTTHPLSPKH